MQKNIITFLVIILLGLAGIAGAVYLMQHSDDSKEVSEVDVSMIGDGIEGNATITEETPIQSRDFSKPLSFNADVSSDVKALLQKRFDEVQDVLNADATNFNAWVQLALLRKSSMDYEGAAEDLRYVAGIYPKSTIPFDNLGDLYLNFIPNYPKAEANFKASLAFNPNNINAYQQLFALYTTYGFKANTSAAADLIAQGLKDNPNNQTLLQFQLELQEGN